jgi:hypothetical protein
LAEALGVLLGDGCLGRTTSRGRNYYQVAFTAHPSEFHYYETFIKPTIESSFGVRGRLFLRDDNTTRYHLSGTKLADQLIVIGIPVGKKVDASIPRPVRESGQVIPFIRGVYHAEGSIYHRYSKGYNTHVRVYDNLLTIQIRMKLRTLMTQITEELNNCGIVTNRLTEKDGVYTLRITNQSMIREFLDLVRPRYKNSPASNSLIHHA